ncbi:meiotic nuclear division protein 1 [Basidiobolus meristosporus CBS 931.73]|uniref:Meiotic nuclear division protein 1 n=1 Tax=Basidiobolus meristosporus CBS 931.73 TaxID=1314790 RepID=A0A1Y1YIT2_9FUNG|nr:meiotic nuclear division protein 1 [Basidiobolus meristosporus CBS 931.73]|eukprot:ORX97534.1 meiotic nuclear division protein 1 [Basidiobolus meristosporus CBS 931.73]
MALYTKATSRQDIAKILKYPWLAILSRKGLSLEEKRKRMEAIFHETKEFFQLKELEKIAPKTKGIVMQSVKDVLQSLVDDNLVTAEKIGTSNYFWSFPSTALQSRKRKIDDLTDELQSLTKKHEELQKGIEEASAGRENSDDRGEKLAKLAEAESLKESNLKELQKFRDCDPALLETKAKAADVAKEAANRWTENIFILQSYCCNKFNIERSEFDKQFQIPEDFDTIP